MAFATASALLLTENRALVADSVRYVATSALGDGSGSTADNAAHYADGDFWTTVRNSLAQESAEVTFLDGQYVSHNLLLRDFGNPVHHITLRSQSPGGAVFASDKFIDLRGVRNAAVLDFGFTGGNPNGSARKLHVNSSDGTPTGTPSQNILIAGNRFYDAPTHYGGIGITHFSHHVTLHDNYFRNVGSRNGSHMIYNSYDVHHIKVIGNHFEDSPGDYVRFRDNSDFGEVRNNTFISTSDDYNLIFVRFAVFNDVNPGDEIHASNYLVRDNHFQFFAGRDQDAIAYSSSGYEPVGLNFMPSAEDGEILKNGTVDQKRTLFRDTMNIDLSKVRIYGNAFENENREFVYWARAEFGATSQGWTGRADITGTENSLRLGAGDVHSNATFDTMDVSLFLQAIDARDELDFLLNDNVWFGDYAAADINRDGQVDLEDVQPFLDQFTGRVPDVALEPVRSLLNAGTLDGDYNSDGIVDAADYTIWRNRDGSQHGYETWKANFGKSTAGRGPSPNAAPEPGVCGMLYGVVALARSRWRKQGDKRYGSPSTSRVPWPPGRSWRETRPASARRTCETRR